jgi:hypothetical protein
MAYILAHGTKEGLVASPLDWPGVSTARALASGEALRGVWRTRTKVRHSEAERAASALEPDEGDEIQLTPIPSWAHLSVEERHSRACAMIATIEEQYRHRAHAGVEAVLSQDPAATPADFVRRPAPRVHASRPDSEATFLTARAAFVVAYHEAKKLTQEPALELASRYPAGALPPRPPMSPRAGRPATARSQEPMLAS